MISRNDAWCLALPLVLGVATARGDQVITDTHQHHAANIVGFDDGQLLFRTPDGTLHTAWIESVRMLVADRGGAFADFNQAERYFYKNQPERAVVRYQRASRMSEGYWRGLVSARHVMAAEAAGHIDAAVRGLLILLDSEGGGLAVASRLIPQKVPQGRNRRGMRAVEHIDAALAAESDDDRRIVLELLRFRILHVMSDPRAHDAAMRAALADLPADGRTDSFYALRLEALRRVAGALDSEAFFDALHDAIRHAPADLVPSFLLLKGERQLDRAKSRGDRIRGTWPLMRIVVHFPDHELAPVALLTVATVLESLGKPDKARLLADECARHAALVDADRARVEALRNRLRKDSP